jgi:hypothetical protein
MPPAPAVTRCTRGAAILEQACRYANVYDAAASDPGIPGRPLDVRTLTRPLRRSDDSAPNSFGLYDMIGNVWEVGWKIVRCDAVPDRTGGRTRTDDDRL